MLPKAIFMSVWDPRRGPMLIGQYPADYEIDRDRLLDFLGMALRQGEAAHFSEVEVGGENAIVYYTGMQTRMCFGAIIDEDDDVDALRGAIVRSVVDIIMRGTVPRSMEEWGRLYEKITLYMKMPVEEKMGELFCDPFVVRLYSVLLDLGIVRQDFLLSSLGIIHGDKEEDLLRAYIEILSSLGVVQIYRDEESMREYVFLIRDVVVLRRKPKLFREISSIISAYDDEYSDYIMRYLENKAWRDEQDILARVFSDPQFYKVLKILRERGVIPIEEARDGGIAPQLELLETIDVCRKGDNIYYMFTDIAIVKMFPKYSIYKCLQQYAAGVLSGKEVRSYLEAIKKSYL